LRAIQVTVPQDNRWEPGLAYNFTKQLVSNFSHLVLSISATGNQIAWSLEVPDRLEAAIKSTLYAFYPQCQVEPQPDQNPYTDCWQYDIQTANSFVLPLRYVDEFGQFDPLASVVNAMTDLTGDEGIVYQVALSRPRKNYHQQAKKMFVPSVGQSIVQGVWAGLFKPYSQSQENIQAEQEIRALIEEKLASGSLMDATLSLKVNARSEGRADHLANLVATAFSQFDTELNWLTGAQKKTHPLVLSPREVTALWHLPTEHCQAPGIVWARGVVSVPPPEPRGSSITLGESLYRGQVYKARLAYVDRVTHVNIVGRTRVGKSTFIHN
jgi:hypothetical protein